MATQSPGNESPLAGTPKITHAGSRILLRGSWNMLSLAPMMPVVRRKLENLAHASGIDWDLTQVEALDSAGAFLLWQAWGERLPERLHMLPEHAAIFDRWRHRHIPSLRDMPSLPPLLFMALTRTLLAGVTQLRCLLILLGQLVIDLGYLFLHPADIPWRDISANLHEAGVRALWITALVGFLIGIVLSYLSALQLESYGAQAMVVNILGLGIIRELGPALAATLVAGRSGSAITARLGVMRLTQELDALEAMGISPSLRLILPNVIALMIGLPLLVVWTDAVALLGGSMAAHLEMDLGYRQFLLRLPDVVPVANLAIGMAKGAVFGLCIGMIACHFGLRIEPNTESLGQETTRSVVVSITLVILVDALFAVVFREVGMP